MSTNLDDTMNSAKKTMNDVRDTAGHTASATRSKVMEGMHLAATTITMLRSLGITDALGWVGLQRRRGPFGTSLTFGAGFLAGAAVGLLAAPMAGSDMRRRIAQRVMGMEHRAEETVAHAKSEVQATVAQGVTAVKEAVTTTHAAAEEAIGSNHTKVAPPKVPVADHARS